MDVCVEANQCNTCEPENPTLISAGLGGIHVAVALQDMVKQLCTLNVFPKGKLFQSTIWFSLLSKFFEKKKSMNILKSSIPLYNFKLITSYYCNFIRFILPPRKKKVLTSNILHWFQLVSFHITIMAFHSTRYGLELCFKFEMGCALIKLLFLI